MELFDFLYHRVRERYPDRQNQVQLGGGWTYTIKPATPPAREFTLTFPAMRYFYSPLAVLDETGVRFLSDDDLAVRVESIVADRFGNPGGAR